MLDRTETWHIKAKEYYMDVGKKVCLMEKFY